MISVIIPLYNRADLVGETLDSLLSQTYADWECLVVDDGSTDASVAVVQKYVDEDPRFQILIRSDERTKGAPTCRNIGLESAKGDLLFFLDSDDILTPSFFETVVAKMEEHHEADFALLPFDKFTETTMKTFPCLNSVLEGPSVYHIIFQKFVVSVMSYVWRKQMVKDNHISWNEVLPRSQDTDFAFRCIAASNSGVLVNINPMNHVREHKNNITNQSFFDPDIALTMFHVFIDSYHLLRKNGKMTLENKQLFFRGLTTKTYHISILYGNRKVIRKSCQFIKENGSGVKNLFILHSKLNLLWLFLPAIIPFRSLLLKIKTSPFARWLYKF